MMSDYDNWLDRQVETHMTPDTDPDAPPELILYCENCGCRIPGRLPFCPQCHLPVNE